MNDFLNDLCTWLKGNIWGRKVLFTANRVAGNQLLRMAAAHDAPAVNVVPTTVREYMTSLAAPSLKSSGLKRIDSLTATIALQQIMKESGDAFTTMGTVELSTAGSVLPQLDELERNGITPDQLAGTGEDLLSAVWRRFLAWKRDNHYATEKEILDAAAIPEGVSLAILSSVEVDQTERAFLSKIPGDRLKVIRLKTPDGDEFLRNAFLPKPPGSSVREKGTASGPECFVCQDIGAEVRFACQYLIEHEIPAEQAVIVCPDDAIGLRVFEEGRLLGLGMDSLFGFPAATTKTAQMIHCLLDWANRNYDVEALAPALLSGSMGVYDDQDEMRLSGLTMLRIFRHSRVGWGKERWENLASSGYQGSVLAGTLMKAWVDFFEAPPRPLREVALDLADLLRRSMIHSDENRLYLTFVDELSRIYSGEMKGREYLSRVEEVAASQKIRTQTADQPGNVYCCSYENALFINRRHFLMLGMNWDAFDSLAAEFPLLHDDKKARLSPHLQLVQDRAMKKRHAVKEFLVNRQEAHVVFCRALMDHVGGEDLIPSSIFEDAARRYIVVDPQTGKKTDTTPQISILGRNPLTELDVYLKTGRDPGLLPEKEDPVREEKWAQAFWGRCHTATALEKAAVCPRKYTLSVHMGIDTEKPEALEQFGQTWLSALDRGNLVHHVLDEYFAAVSPRRDSPDLRLLEELLSAQIDEYRQRVPVPSNLTDLTPETEAIRNVVFEAARMHADDPLRQTIGTEVSFGTEKPILLSFGNARLQLSGRIDRVDQVGHEYEIIDYKTGRPGSFRRNLSSKLQYYLYSLAWETLHPDQRISRASYYMLDAAGGIELIQIDMSSEKRAQMHQKMIDLLDLISDPVKAFTPAFDLDETKAEKGADSCPDTCPFKPLCREVFG